MREEVLKLIKEKGLLLEKDVFDLINGFESFEFIKDFLENLERVSGQKIITKRVLKRNLDYVKSFVGNLSGDNKKTFEKIFINFGISLELIREKETVEEKEIEKINNTQAQEYKVFYIEKKPDKKLEVKDFVEHFRSRFQQLQTILISRPELQHNLVSIDKISSDRSSLAIIGMVVEKRITKNKNFIISFEDMTGGIKALAKFDNEELFAKVEELQLDDIVGIRASGNRDILFIHDIFYPDSFLHKKATFENDVSVAFLSDLHCGSDRHLSNSFEKFLEWINSKDILAKKIKYLFFTGDNVDGVGVFPGQEKVLDLKSMREQYNLLFSYLRKIPKRITMFMCPGQHDATRVAEPQPRISKKYAPELYQLENLVLVANPSMVKLLEGDKEFKILMYHGASIHTFINEIKELREMKAHSCPAKAVRHMLKRRHLAPIHSEAVYIPNADKDPLAISEVPDVLITGEVHRCDIENYNGILIITGSCWQAQTSFEEKVGNVPVPGKVPILNLKTREIKILDFLGEEES